LILFLVRSHLQYGEDTKRFFLQAKPFDIAMELRTRFRMQLNELGQRTMGGHR